MRHLAWTTLWLATTSGCVSLETDNPWTDLERAEVSAVRPVELPELAADLSNLDLVLQAALDNAEIAEANADELEALGRSYNRLLEAGEAEADLSLHRLRMLEEERRGRLLDKLSVPFLLLVLGLSAAL